jgi:methylmalonyl-CoA mutase C-terminal domain/subunit
MVIGGGIIPEQDFQLLYDAGLKAIFVPGATLDTIVTWINTNVKPRA